MHPRKIEDETHEIWPNICKMCGFLLVEEQNNEAENLFLRQYNTNLQGAHLTTGGLGSSLWGGGGGSSHDPVQGSVCFYHLPLPAFGMAPSCV